MENLCWGLDELEELGRGGRNTKVLPSPPPRPLGACFAEGSGISGVISKRRGGALGYLRMGCLAWVVEILLSLIFAFVLFLGGDSDDY